MSKIEWTDETWNPTTGCNKVSEGCKNCYAEVQHRRMMAMHPKKYKRPFLDGAFADEASLENPLHFKKPTKFFVNSMSDLFHENISFTFIARVFRMMEDCPQHTFQVLTKRPERMLEFWNWFSKHALPPAENVWLGVSCENQKAADERIPLLLQVPAAVRFLSCEPLFGEINIRKYFTMLRTLHWVIAGGESGHHARPMHPDWARGLRDQCKAAGVPFFFKQWGEWSTEKIFAGKRKNISGTYLKSNGFRCGFKSLMDGNPDYIILYKSGKNNTGRLLDGREWNEFPETSSKFEVQSLEA